jgi:hypothetical protein
LPFFACFSPLQISEKTRLTLLMSSRASDLRRGLSSTDIKNLKDIANKSGWTVNELCEAISPASNLPQSEEPDCGLQLWQDGRKESERLGLEQAVLADAKSAQGMGNSPLREEDFSPPPDNPRIVSPLSSSALHLLHLRLINTAVSTIERQVHIKTKSSSDWENGR